MSEGVERRGDEWIETEETLTEAIRLLIELPASTSGRHDAILALGRIRHRVRENLPWATAADRGDDSLQPEYAQVGVEYRYVRVGNVPASPWQFAREAPCNPLSELWLVETRPVFIRHAGANLTPADTNSDD